MTPLQCQHITCRRPAWNGQPQHAAEDFSASFATGFTTAFHSGDSDDAPLLLSILGMVETPDSGWIRVLGKSVLKMETSAAHRSRGWAFSFHFMHPHLLPPFTVEENIGMPCLRLCEHSIDAARERVAEVWDMAGLDVSCANLVMGHLDEASHWRVAFARSIAHRPKILVTDSPPALFLLPLAWHYAQQTVAAVLGNTGSLDATGLCDRILSPGSRRISIPAA